MKKLFYKLFGISTLVLLGCSWLIWIVSAQTAPMTEAVWFWGGIKAGGVGVAWVNEDWGLKNDSIIDSVKTFVNRVLGLLALITLLLLLRGWFQMVTAAWDDGKYKEWFKILKQAAFGLAFIWLTWLMVSLMFYVIWLMVPDVGGSIS